ncbi:tetratricopeptide repeat protein [Mariniflexile soesokkakense]|uniref:Tetratricopeptide repeat protein n=1 Tax=Mariniflexile soesokkakense TaxID=1343160 RepID=A0ABV0ADU2_9FLAO
MKTSFLFFCLNVTSFLLTIGVNLFAQQNTDSLAHYYKLCEDKTQNASNNLQYANKLIDLAIKNNNSYYTLNGLSRKSYLLSKTGDYNGAISTAKLFLNESKKIKDSSNLLLAYRKLADYSRLNDSLLNAYSYYQEHKSLNVLFKDSLEIIRDLRFMSSIQYNLGLIYESESTAVEAITLLDCLKETDKTIDAKIGLYNHLGIIYKEIGSYNRALELYNKLLLITKNHQYLNIIHGNIANVYKEQGNYTLAIAEFKKVYDNSLKTNKKKEIARALNNLGLAKSKLNYPEALTELETALQIRKSENDYAGLFSSYIALTEYFIDRKVTNKARLYSNNAYGVSVKTNNKLDRIKALSYIIELEKGEKIVEYKNLTDSVANAKQINENKFSYIKYNYNKKEKEAQEVKLKYIQSELKATKERANKVIYQFLGLLLILVLVFSYIILKSKHKKDKLQVVYNTESRIAKKVHDEVANDVYHAMTKLQNDSNNKEDLLDDLENIYIRTRDISKGISDINVKTNFNELLYDLLISYKSQEIGVIAKNLSTINWNGVNDIKRATVYRVLQELMTNMKKHSKANIVLVSFSQTKNKIKISYTDNGMGCKISKQNGLLNTENRIASINGTIIFESELGKGFKATITI